MAMTRKELDAGMCQSPGCNHRGHATPLYFSGRCHPRGPQEVWYDNGELHVQCMVCKKQVAVVAVADEKAKRMRLIAEKMLVEIEKVPGNCSLDDLAYFIDELKEAFEEIVEIDREGEGLL